MAGNGLSWQPGEATPDEVRRQIRWLDHRANDPAVRELREWALRELGVRPGDRVVDVGSGTGADVIELADRVAPGGTAIGVEPSRYLRAEAALRAGPARHGTAGPVAGGRGTAAPVERRGTAGPGCRFVAGVAAALPFRAASVDAVRCERVLQHLREPQVAVAEFGRILRPGGRAVVIDMDWGTTVLHPGDPTVAAAAIAAQCADLPNPYAGRRLAGQLTAAGLTVVARTARSLIFPGVAAAVRGVPGHLAARAAQQGLITERQRAGFVAALLAGAERGDLHFSVTMFAVAARR